MQITATVLAAALLAAAQTPAQPTQANAVRIDRCVISLIDEIDVPAESPGVLKRMDVEDGGSVEQGALLALMDDRDVQAKVKAATAELKRAQLQAQSRARVEYAQKAVGVAEKEYLKNLEIKRQTPAAVTDIELERSRLAWEQANAQLAVSELDHALDQLSVNAAAAELEAAQNELDRRSITAPVTGVVEQIFRKPGEWVQAGETILRVLRMDRLRVEGVLNGSDFSPHELHGRPVLVEVPMANGQVERLRSTITYAASRIEASGDFFIWAEVENRQVNGHWILLPGKEASMILSLDAPATLPAAVNR